jgi:hypothetical protein
MIQDVQDEVGDVSQNMLVRIAKWANEYHHQLCNMRKWKWLDVVSDSILISQANYPFPINSLKVGGVATPASKIIDVVDVDYTPNFALVETTVDTIRTSYQDYDALQSGPPQYWYPFTPGVIKLFCNPDTTGRNYTIRFRQMVLDFPAWSSPGNIAIPDDWRHVLRNQITAKALRFLDDTRAKDFLDDYNSGLVLMKNDDSNNTVIVDRRSAPPNFVKFPLLAKDS